VPRPGQEFDSSTLPDPEINPLLNPLLAANMGRWAEVYFTTPPEKRGQAIYDLIRELQQNASDAPLTSEPLLSSEITSSDNQTDKSETAEPSSTSDLICSQCGHENPIGQRFCGMCGTPLFTEADAQASERSVVTPATVFDERANDEKINEERSLPHNAEGFSSLRDDPAPGYAEVERYRQYDLPSFAVEPEPVPYRYRLYVGLVMAVLLGALLYMAWRGTNAFSGGARQPALSQAVPADQPPATPSAQPPSAANALPPPTQTPSTEPPSKEASSSAAPAPTARFSSEKTTTAPVKRERSAQPAAQVVPAANHLPDVSSSQGGAEEFAIGEKYLNGNSGTIRDSNEGAQWLWKAVGKGNLPAMVALSDLYLHGDGVAKSCDQGRLLLDAAARKGAKGAAERLRNLQAFGCQ